MKERVRPRRKEEEVKSGVMRRLRERQKTEAGRRREGGGKALEKLKSGKGNYGSEF